MRSRTSSSPSAPFRRGRAGRSMGERLEALILGCLAKDAASSARRLAAAREAAPDAAPPRRGRNRLPRALSGPRGWRAPRSRKIGRRRGRQGLQAGLGGGDAELSGPPERTISLPTRTFRAGSRQRRRWPRPSSSLLLISCHRRGAWALFGPTAGGMPEPIPTHPEPLRETPPRPLAQQRAENQGRREPVGPTRASDANPRACPEEQARPAAAKRSRRFRPVLRDVLRQA